jgi:hypothetical protein
MDLRSGFGSNNWKSILIETRKIVDVILYILFLLWLSSIASFIVVRPKFSLVAK